MVNIETRMQKALAADSVSQTKSLLHLLSAAEVIVFSVEAVKQNREKVVRTISKSARLSEICSYSEQGKKVLNLMIKFSEQQENGRRS